MATEFAGRQSGDLLQDFAVFLLHHKSKETQLAALREQNAGLMAALQSILEMRASVNFKMEAQAISKAALADRSHSHD